MAGIKRKEYLLYLANVRAEEQQAWDRGYRITRKSIEEIRKEFQAKYGSIYYIKDSCVPSVASATLRDVERNIKD